MPPAIRRGEVYRVRHPQHGDPKKSRCFVIVSRQELLATEVSVGIDEGLKHPSVVNCDQLTRLEKTVLTDYVGVLGSKKLGELRTALRVALSVD